MSIASAADWKTAFADRPKNAIVEMPELGEGKTVEFRKVMNMGDFAACATGMENQMFWRLKVFARLALAPDGGFLVDTTREDWVDRLPFSGKLVQLAVVRSGIADFVMDEMKSFTEALSEGGGGNGPKQP